MPVQVNVGQADSLPIPIAEHVQEILRQRPAMDDLDRGDLLVGQEVRGRKIGREKNPSVIEPAWSDRILTSKAVGVEQEGRRCVRVQTGRLEPIRALNQRLQQWPGGYNFE